MSLTKRALPEDVDVTDPRDGMVNPAEEAELDRREQEQEIATGWAIFELAKAAKFLHENAYRLTVGDLQDISKATLQLQDIPKKVTKPF